MSLVIHWQHYNHKEKGHLSPHWTQNNDSSSELTPTTAPLSCLPGGLRIKTKGSDVSLPASIALGLCTLGISGSKNSFLYYLFLLFGVWRDFWVYKHPLRFWFSFGTHGDDRHWLALLARAQWRHVLSAKPSGCKGSSSVGRWRMASQIRRKWQENVSAVAPLRPYSATPLKRHQKSKTDCCSKYPFSTRVGIYLKIARWYMSLSSLWYWIISLLIKLLPACSEENALRYFISIRHMRSLKSYLPPLSPTVQPVHPGWLWQCMHQYHRLSQESLCHRLLGFPIHSLSQGEEKNAALFKSAE